MGTKLETRKNASGDERLLHKMAVKYNIARICESGLPADIHELLHAPRITRMPRAIRQLEAVLRRVIPHLKAYDP